MKIKPFTIVGILGLGGAVILYFGIQPRYVGINTNFTMTMVDAGMKEATAKSIDPTVYFPEYIALFSILLILIGKYAMFIGGALGIISLVVVQTSISVKESEFSKAIVDISENQLMTVNFTVADTTNSFDKYMEYLELQPRVWGDRGKIDLHIRLYEDEKRIYDEIKRNVSAGTVLKIRPKDLKVFQKPSFSGRLELIVFGGGKIRVPDSPRESDRMKRHWMIGRVKSSLLKTEIVKWEVSTIQNEDDGHKKAEKNLKVEIKQPDKKGTILNEREEFQLNNPSMVNKYITSIVEKVKRKWRKPAGIGDTPECEVHVLQGPGGIVLNVEFGACSGSTTKYRASIESAVYSADPFPRPEHPELFMTNITFIFSPI